MYEDNVITDHYLFRARSTLGSLKNVSRFTNRFLCFAVEDERESSTMPSKAPDWGRLMGLICTRIAVRSRFLSKRDYKSFLAE